MFQTYLKEIEKRGQNMGKARIDTTNIERVSTGETGALPAKASKRLPEQQHKENPFLDGFTVPLKWKRSGLNTDPIAVLNTVSGELTDAAEITKKYVYDAEKFLKVFRAQLGIFFELSGPGMKVLTAIWMAVSDGAENGTRIYLSERIAADYAKRCHSDLSRPTYFRGRKELMERGIIAQSEEMNLYWLNPAVFFNGDRVKLILEIQKAPEIVPPGQKFSRET